jgi:hypothetical protein
MHDVAVLENEVAAKAGCWICDIMKLFALSDNIAGIARNEA